MRVVCCKCGHELRIGEFAFCPHEPVTKTSGTRDLRGFGARIWTGEQVYGREYLQSERGTQDTIDAISGVKRYGLIKG